LEVVAQRLVVVGLQLTIDDDWALVTADKVVIERSAIVAAEREEDFIVLVVTGVVS
jgi:hypothetical protein